MNDIFYDISVGIALALICAVGRFLWKKITAPPDTPSDADPKKTRTQFFVALFCAAATPIAASLVPDRALSVLLWFAFFISLLVLWGAFDAVFSHKDPQKTLSQQKPDQDPK